VGRVHANLEINIPGSQYTIPVRSYEVIVGLAFQIKSNKVGLISCFLKRIFFFIAVHDGIDGRNGEYPAPRRIGVLPHLNSQFVFLSDLRERSSVPLPSLIDPSGCFAETILPPAP